MALAAVVVTVLNVTLSVLRWTIKPVSLLELSVQARSMREFEKVVAVKLIGAVGAVGKVVSDAAEVYDESPPVLVAATL